MNLPLSKPPREPNRRPPRWVLILLLLGLIIVLALPFLFIYYAEYQNKRLDKGIADAKAELKEVQAEQDSWKPEKE